GWGGVGGGGGCGGGGRGGGGMGGRINSANSSEASVNRPSGFICQTKRNGCRRSERGMSTCSGGIAVSALTAEADWAAGSPGTGEAGVAGGGDNIGSGGVGASTDAWGG